ncbi:MAG: hypothetical protein JRN20_04305 [Nitrososphaerota archaeon]|nr:hypothetical protein [Nitrososphaerota archaeon]MDG6923702.1 hypothetical protein [Nitrososphaerota archaeon]
MPLLSRPNRPDLQHILNAGMPLREVVTSARENERESPAVLYSGVMHGSIEILMEVATEIRRVYLGEFMLLAPTMPCGLQPRTRPKLLGNTKGSTQ